MEHSEQTIIYCDGLLDGTGAPAVHEAAIRIEGEHIKAVGPAAKLKPQPGERLAEVDFRGFWVAPGLIDEHTHLSLAGDGRSYEEMAPWTPMSSWSRLEAAAARLHMRLSHFGQMLDAGLLPRMVAGSDSGPGHVAFGHLDYDLQLMVRGGMTPAQVLESATRVAAEAMGFGDQLGTLTPGKLADIIAVEDGPSRDITALSRVHAVFQSGRRVV